MALFWRGKEEMQDLELFQYKLNPIHSMWLFIFYEEEWECSGIGNEGTPQEEGKPGRGLCSASWPWSKFPYCTSWRGADLHPLRVPSQQISVPFSRCISTMFWWRHTSFAIAAGVKLSNGFSRLWDRLLAHGTTHFSISSNPVLHFSDSEKKPLKHKLLEHIECRTVLLVLLLIHYSKQCHLK